MFGNTVNIICGDLSVVAAGPTRGSARWGTRGMAAVASGPSRGRRGGHAAGGAAGGAAEGRPGPLGVARSLV